MSPDRAAPLLPEPSPGLGADGTPAAGLPASARAARTSVGLLEIALPLWHWRWWLLLSTVLCGVVGAGLALAQPVRFTGQASFVVQPQLRPSQSVSVVASALPALAGLVGPGGSPVDLYVAVLRSQAVADRIVDRFELMRVWNLKFRVQAHQRLGQRVQFGVGRRDGVVVVTVEDDHPQRAAALANEYVEELRQTLRGFAVEEAQQRRKFYEAQLGRARSALEEAQRKLQASGFDRAALRAEPRAAAESYGRMQAEVTSAEVRLAAMRRVRTDSSGEIQTQLTELAALRAQLAAMAAPQDLGQGSFVGRVREFRYAETLAESIARQAEAARVDEATDAVPVQMLDRARAPEWPSSPRLFVWLAAGALAGLLLPAAWVLLRHRMALARLDVAYMQRIETIRSVLPRRR